MKTKIIFALLFLLPFVVFPFGTSYFETPKVFLAELGICLLFLFTSGNISLKTYSKTIKIGFAALIVLIFYHIITHYSQLLLFGNVFRFQGSLLLLLLLFFAVLSSSVKLLSFPAFFYILVLLAQLIFAFLFGTTTDGRLYGTIGEPNSFAAFALFVWPFAYFALPKDKNLFHSVIIFFLTACIIFLSGSRSGVIAFIIQLFYLYLIKKTSLSYQVSMVICLILISFSLILPQFVSNTVYENRNEIWQTALKAGQMHPLLGGGFGNTELLLREASYRLLNNIRFQYVDSSHNIFLDWFVQGGLIGLCILLLFLGTTLHRLVKRNMQMHILILIGIITVMSFNPVSVIILLVFWWIVGQSLITGANNDA